MTATTAESRSISLNYREGTSDKEYHVRLEPKGNGFVVNFAYGRRGSTLNTGTKTATPVDYETALKTFDNLVKEKKARGYTEGESGAPYPLSEAANRVSGLLPQLLNPVGEEPLPRLLRDPHWAMQEKKDGKRLLLRKENGLVEGINKKGLIVDVPQTIVTSASELPGDFVMDGEAIGNVLHAFDLLILKGEDLRSRTCKARYTALMNLLAGGPPRHIKLVSCFVHPQDKGAWLETFRRQKAEGVVFKHWNAPYTAGRPASGGTQLKHKFVATLSAVVSKVNAQRSVALRLLNHEGWQPVGNVTIPVNHEVPAVGAVVEVRYLYAYPDGALYQPVYLGPRSDVGQEECVCSQLKFKREEEEEA